MIFEYLRRESRLLLKPAPPVSVKEDESQSDKDKKGDALRRDI